MFKFKIGQLVDVMDGWELPITSSAQIINRKRVLVGFGSNAKYVSQYRVKGQTAAATIFIYDEEQLRHIPGSEEDKFSQPLRLVEAVPIPLPVSSFTEAPKLTTKEATDQLGDEC